MDERSFFPATGFLSLLLCTPLATQGPARPSATAPAPDVVRLQPETGPRVTFKKCYRGIRGVPTKPNHVRRAPKSIERWFVFPWGEGVAVLARRGDQLWPDRDGDGDLREEDPVAVGSGRGLHLTMKLTLPSGPIDARLELDFVGAELRLTNLTRMSGKVRIGERDVAFSLDDYLCNGRYDDYYTCATKEYWLCDHVHFDMDGDGRFYARIPPAGEDYSLARGFVFAEKVYELEVLRAGEAVRFRPTDRRVAAVEVNVKAFEIALVSDEFGYCHLVGKDGTARLPEGRYRLTSCEYEKGTHRYRGLWWKEDGVRWLDIREGTKFDLGGPLRYELYHEPNSRGGLEVWSICYGPNGERVMLWHRRKSIKPTVRIASMGGDTLFSVLTGYC